jgi:hypothetical protein
MKKVIPLLILIFTSGLAAFGQSLTVDDVVGEWTGDSTCRGSNKSCHDETVLYHFSAIKGDAGKVHLAADKLVGGKWELMGEMDLKIDRYHRTLSTEFPIPRTGGKGILIFYFKGDKMDGDMMIYPENELGREIHVTRKKDAK